MGMFAKKKYKEATKWTIELLFKWEDGSAVYHLNMENESDATILHKDLVRQWSEGKDVVYSKSHNVAIVSSGLLCVTIANKKFLVEVSQQDTP